MAIAFIWEQHGKFVITNLKYKQKHLFVRMGKQFWFMVTTMSQSTILRVVYTFPNLKMLFTANLWQFPSIFEKRKSLNLSYQTIKTLKKCFTYKHRGLRIMVITNISAAIRYNHRRFTLNNLTLSYGATSSQSNHAVGKYILCLSPYSYVYYRSPTFILAFHVTRYFYKWVYIWYLIPTTTVCGDPIDIKTYLRSSGTH